jgi:hypothetical protein
MDIVYSIFKRINSFAMKILNWVFMTNPLSGAQPPRIGVIRDITPSVMFHPTFLAPLFLTNGSNAGLTERFCLFLLSGFGPARRDAAP